MNCADYQEWLQRSLDGTADRCAFELDSHLERCGRCRALELARVCLDTGLHSFPTPTPSRGLSDRIVAVVLADRRARRRRRRAAGMVLAVAACLLCLGVAAILRSLNGNRSEGDLNSEPVGIVSRTGSAYEQEAFVFRIDRPASMIHDLLMLGLFPADAPHSAGNRIRLLGTMTRLARALDFGGNGERGGYELRERFVDASSTIGKQIRANADEGKTLLDIVTPMPADAHADSLAVDPTQTWAEAGQHVQAGLGPVTGSARRAVDLFLREVPTLPAEAR